jgi:hypothetical protein
MDYLLPFLIILAGIVVLVLLFNVAKSIFANDKEQSAYMHVVEGDVQMRTWGTKDFLTLSTDALIMEGDEIAVSSGSKIIVEFFDGTILRASSGTDLAFEQISGEGKDAAIGVVLVEGNLWINKVYANEAVAQTSVKAGSAVVHAGQNTVFAVSKDPEVDAYGIQGSGILMDIMDKAGQKIVQTEEMGVGQEIVLMGAALDRYWKFQSPNVLAAISDQFKTSEWYTWNKQEDQKPTQFEKSADMVKVEPEVVGPAAGAETEPQADGTAVTPTTVDDASTTTTTPTTGAFAAPVLVSVANQTKPNADGYFVVTSRVATIAGTVLNTAAKVTVNDYVLQKFKAGDMNWAYFANADFGLMKEGKNTFKIYAYDASGAKSGELTVNILYQPPVAPAASAATPDATTANDANTSSSVVPVPPTPVE